ncbi:hypothetical protein PoB_002034900 [Plakobranchus ocellatus]|uniref:Uncharacterized protein n=1 Tax=Plakobranchus ocellatus TaxID=259542 RepID=A0AAV3ZHI2_9GAST|nr:hypothetical protein PoB_002034900 [Plakobranchus ocellatus]
MDPNQWNTYNIQYGHPPSGGLPSVHPSLNRLDLSPAGLSHQLQAGRGVPSLQAVNYQTLSGLPILDTLSPLTSGLSAQGHQLVFDPQTNRISAEPQHPTPAQQLASPHSYENAGGGHSKSSNSRNTSESLNRNQLLEAARMWSTSATNFTSPTSLYNQFNAALFPQSVENPPASPSVSASSGQLSVSSVSKSSQNYTLHQQSPCLHDPPPAHSSNMSGTSRLLPVVQRPPEHSLQLGASDTLYNSSRSTPSVTETVSQVTRPLFTTHKAVVLGVGNSGLAQLQQDLHRQTPGQQQHQQQNFYQAHRRGEIEDLSSGNTHNNIYGSYANLSTQSSNFISNAQHHHQHLSSGDLSYEAVSPAPPLQQQQQHQRQQQESNMAAHHPSLSFNLGQFPELSNLTAEQAHAFSDKFQENEMRLQMDTRVQTAQNSNTLASTTLQRHQGSSGPSLKIPSQQQQHPKSSAEISGRPTGVTVTSQNVRMQSAASYASVSQQQPAAVSSSLLNTPSAPSPIQALADSTTKPKRSRARKKKGESTSLPVITSANASDTNPVVLSQMHPSPQSESIAPSSSRDSNQGKKSNLPPSNFQSQEHLSQAGLNLTSPHQHISTLSMAHTSNSQQPSYARVQIPSASQSFSINDQQTFRNNTSFSKIPTNHNAPGIRQQVEFEKTPPTYKHQQKPISKTKVNVPGPGGQQLQQAQAYSQHAGNLSQTRGSALLDSQGRVLNYVAENQHKVDGQINSTQGVNATGPYSKLLGQDQILVSDSGNCNHLQQPDHLLEEENSRVQQHYQMDFGSQPFIEQLAGVSATPSTSDYGGEVVLTNLVSHEETARLQQQQQQSGSSLGIDTRPSYDDIRSLDHLSGQQINQLEMEEVQFNTMFSQNDQVTGHGSLQEELPPAPEPEMTLTFVPHVVEDDELGHFTNPELSEPVPMLPKQKQNQPRVLSLPSMSSCGTDSFQNSFLSYLQGHKQETLSSVSSSAVTKKPQLPKYIPEPKRPKPPPPPAAANKLATSKDSSQSFFNADDSSKRGRDLISTFSDTPSQKSESGKEGYSVQRTSDLAVKITLPKSKSKSRFGPFAESTLLKDSMRKNRERKRKRGRGLGDDDDDVPAELSDDETQPAQRKKPVPKQVAPTPTRASIGRKAKDKCIEMTKKHSKLFAVSSLHVY